MTWWPIALGWLVVVNLLTALAIALDKQQAGQGGRRISELTLLLMSLAGGSPGALLTMRWVRHKTRKTSFQLRLAVMIAFQLIAGAALAAWSLGWWGSAA